METKPSYLSKTNWWSLIVALAAFFPDATVFIAANPDLSMWLFAAVSFVLRMVSKDKVTLY